MILMASGRCDLPAFYSSWFFRRLEEGFLDVRNPYNKHQISRIYLNDKNIDGICFCTKNPIPMLHRLDEIPFPFLFHVTITPYRTDLEPNVIDKKMVMEAVRSLSSKIGKERVIVRYDPILINPTYTLSYHELAFERLCKQLSGAVSSIVISFVDDYKNLRKHAHEIQMQNMDEALMHAAAARIGPIARRYGIPIQTCAERVHLEEYGIYAVPCFEKKTLSSLFQRSLTVPQTPGVRTNCACLPTVDIGDYNCCSHFCKYCYANYDEVQIQQRMQIHDPRSSVLLGHIQKEDRITVREEKNIQQESLF